MQNHSTHLPPSSLRTMDDLPVAALVEMLRAIPPEAFSPATVSARLRDVRVDDASLQRYLSWKPRGYTRNSIYRDDVFELLAVCWEPGSCSPIHNHAGQDCWLYVHAGALCIEGFDLADPAQDGRCGDGICVRKRRDVERIEGGAVDHRGPLDDIHRVICRRAYGMRAVSLHVYARPFDACIVYEPSRGRASLKTLRYDTIDGSPVA